METQPTHCQFEHPGFATLGTPVFRLTKDDRIAALTIRVDNADVVVPLRSVSRLFDIRADSADANMLRLVEQALRFVHAVGLGDSLPNEILTGEASWDAGSYNLQVATARLQLQLLQWIGGIAGAEEGRITSRMLLVSIDDPAIRPRIQEAMRRAAAELGIENGDAVATRLGALAQELAFVEALRSRLLERVRGLVSRLAQVSKDLAGTASARRETLFQVSRFGLAALDDLTGRFEQIDAVTGDIMLALREFGQQQSLIRPVRDRLYSQLMEWGPLLDAWDAVPVIPGREPDSLWRIIDETYRFLAPRYMPVQQWQTVMAAPDKGERGKNALVW